MPGTDNTTPTEDDVVHLVELKAGETVRVRYRNWRGEIAIRTIHLDCSPFWGKTKWHPEPGWLISGTDVDKGEGRIWSVAAMEVIDNG